MIANGFFSFAGKNTIVLDFHRHFSCYSLPANLPLCFLNRAPGSGMRLGLVRSSSASYSASISVGVRRAVPDLVLTTFEWLARRGRLGKVDKLG